MYWSESGQRADVVERAEVLESQTGESLCVRSNAEEYGTPSISLKEKEVDVRRLIPQDLFESS